LTSILQKALSATAIALVVAAFAYSGVSSAEEKAKPPACKTIKEEAGCTTRDDCTWVKASIDTKTQKEKRKAYCRAKPKPKTPAKKT